jgi:hypothetical protein
MSIWEKTVEGNPDLEPQQHSRNHSSERRTYGQSTEGGLDDLNSDNGANDLAFVT